MSADAMERAKAIASTATPPSLADARCKVYARRYCRCGHTARQHRGGFGPCFAAPNICACSALVTKGDVLQWCDTHHRPATRCEAAQRATTTTGPAGGA